MGALLKQNDYSIDTIEMYEDAFDFMASFNEVNSERTGLPWLIALKYRSLADDNNIDIDPYLLVLESPGSYTTPIATVLIQDCTVIQGIIKKELRQKLSGFIQKNQECLINNFTGINHINWAKRIECV